MRAIYVDMDGVLAKGLTEIDLYKEPDVFDGLRLMPGAKTGIEIVSRIAHMKGYKLIICSKTFSDDVETHIRQHKGKMDWLRTKGIEHLFDGFEIHPTHFNKASLVYSPKDILIDDYGGNCRAWLDAGGFPIQFPEHKSKDWQTARDWVELVFILWNL